MLTYAYNLACTVETELYLENIISPALTSHSFFSVAIPFQHSQCSASHCTSLLCAGVMTPFHLYSTTDGTTGKPHHLHVPCYRIPSVQDYSSTRRERRREGQRDCVREGGGMYIVGLSKLYQQDWSPPTGGLSPARLRS